MSVKTELAEACESALHAYVRSMRGSKALGASATITRSHSVVSVQTYEDGRLVVYNVIIERDVRE